MQRNLRLSPELLGQIQVETKTRGFESVAAFIREALRNEVSHRAGELATAEERIKAILERSFQEVKLLNAQQQATVAMLDALVKLVLTCVPEPQDPGTATAIAKRRYQRFQKALGMETYERNGQ
jgi:Arc/MetJ-type ribon-helix-helix transcriptional regulator